ncbi:MAG: SMI1/KNR4 family protein [Rhizobiaceae bacterium]|jgi:cell wall assembly regulator SMI1|nr:SMI1/KNR4 family protein [Rhizobiaceae bacterium]
MTNWTHEIRRFLESASDAEVGAGASELEIQAAEKSLGVTFPIRFREYLSWFGYVSAAHWELNGLGEGVPAHLNLVTETLLEREQFRPHIPRSLLPLENNGAGDHSCLDLSSGNDDPPIVFWDHEKDERQVPTPEADHFSQWLEQRVRASVA